MGLDIAIVVKLIYELQIPKNLKQDVTRCVFDGSRDQRLLVKYQGCVTNILGEKLARSNDRKTRDAQ